MNTWREYPEPAYTIHVTMTVNEAVALVADVINIRRAGPVINKTALDLLNDELKRMLDKP